MLKYFRRFDSDTKLILITTLLSNIGIYMVVPFLAIYLNEMSAISTTDVGIIIGMAFWCQRAGSLLGGILSDFFSIKKTLLFGLLVRIPGYLLIGFVTNFYLLILACCLIAIGSSMYLPAAKSYLVENSSLEERVNMLSTRVVFANMGIALGPVIGLVIFKISPIALFIFVAFVFVVLAFPNSLLKDSKTPRTNNSLKLGDFFELLRHRDMISVAFFMFVFMAIFVQIEVTIPLLTKELFNKTLVSAVFLINAFIVVSFQIYIANWACKKSSNAPMFIGFILLALSFSMINNVSGSYVLLLIAVVIFTFGQIIFQIKLDFESTTINENMVASALGIMSLAGAFGGFFGSYIGTLLYSDGVFSLSLWQVLTIFTLMLSVPALLRKNQA